jgi:hypothetical protein
MSISAEITDWKISPVQLVTWADISSSSQTLVGIRLRRRILGCPDSDRGNMYKMG